MNDLPAPTQRCQRVYSLTDPLALNCLWPSSSSPGEASRQTVLPLFCPISLAWGVNKLHLLLFFLALGFSKEYLQLTHLIPANYPNQRSLTTIKVSPSRGSCRLRYHPALLIRFSQEARLLPLEKRTLRVVTHYSVVKCNVYHGPKSGISMILVERFSLLWGIHFFRTGRGKIRFHLTLCKQGWFSPTAQEKKKITGKKSRHPTYALQLPKTVKPLKEETQSGLAMGNDL